MSDILIRNLPDSVLYSLDSNAARLGLSRAEYLRRQLTQAASVGHGITTASDWAQFNSRFSDLGDHEVMADAWD